MTRLKYIAALPSRAEDPDAGLRTFRFPGSVRDVLRGPDAPAMGHDDLVQSIDQTLDRMQEALAALGEDLGDSYKLEDFRAGSNRPGPNSAA